MLKKQGAPLHWQTVQFLLVTAVMVDRGDLLGDREFCETVEGNGDDCFSCSAVDLKREVALMVEDRAVEESFVVDEVVRVGPTVNVLTVVELRPIGGETVSFAVCPGLGEVKEVEGDRFLKVMWVAGVDIERIFELVIGNDVAVLSVKVGSTDVALYVVGMVDDCWLV